MRGIVVIAFATIVTTSGCAQPPTPVGTPTADQTRPAAAEPTAAAPAMPEAAPTDEMPAANRNAPAPEATSAAAVAAQSDEAPPPEAAPSAAEAVPGAVVAETDERPAATVSASAPAEPAVSDAEPSTTARSAVAVAEPSPQAPVTPSAPMPETSRTPVAPSAAASSADESLASAELDLAGLEQRLRETRAIGVFTKLSLKNQVDDLLDAFRAFYGGRLQVQLAELRERYEGLLFKVLSLLQDSDRELANAIVASREAIWGILSDPEKLARI